MIAPSGELQLVPVKLVGVEISTDTSGDSPSGVCSAIESGINRALTEAGLRPAAVTSRDGKLTIDREPVA